MRIGYVVIHAILSVAFIIMLINLIVEKEPFANIGLLITLTLWSGLSLIKEIKS